MIFEYSSYSFKPKQKEIIFNYRFIFKNKPDLKFREKIVLPQAPNHIDKEALDEVLKGVHLMLGISYYKLYCPKKVKFSYKLSKEQAEFWNLVYQKGLGEFLYQNKLSPSRVAKFAFKNVQTRGKRLKVKDRSLIGIGGGKDSIVLAELFKENNFDFSSFLLETGQESKITEQVIKKIGQKKLGLKRELDKKIFKEYQDGYNGHIPISAIFAWLGLLSAVLYDYRYIVVGNEYSSNFGNLKYKGLEINHQWSKSIEFEQAFQDYVKKFITPDIVYFSGLRHFYELRIVKLFSKYKQYFNLFSSCNRSFKVHKERSQGKWCGECPKCAFMFLMLAAWLPKKDLLKIFNKNLFEDENLLPLFRDLLGLGKLKPFDCVGTFEESQTALVLASKKFKNSLVVKEFLSKVKASNVLEVQNAETLPARFKFLGLDNVLLLGYGKEGKAARKYLENVKVGVADEKLGKQYLKKQADYDLVVKTPGIPKELVTRPYTTGTNIFLSKIQNTVIGVTGSKGKSTTASLIYEILKSGGKKVKLLGNIGEPMLSYQPKKDEILVVELSSYQLDDIDYSPQVAVVTNLFPEHMNYHGSAEKYYQAKKNIIKQADYFIYNSQQKILSNWTKGFLGEAISYNKKVNYKSNLLGQHNQQNIQAAVAVGKLFKVGEKDIKKAISKFKGLPHRLELVGEYQGIKFYDDAISTTPESTIKALESLNNVRTIFLGGEDRGYDFKELEKALKKHKVKNIVLFPDSGKRILKSKKGFNILETSSMRKAVEFAYKNTPQGSICLLSTASPSYSLWDNFKEKGSEFVKLVRNLK